MMNCSSPRSDAPGKGAILKARTAAEIIAALHKGLGGSGEPPTEAELLAWDEAPADATREAAARLAATVGEPDGLPEGTRREAALTRWRNEVALHLVFVLPEDEPLIDEFRDLWRFEGDGEFAIAPRWPWRLTEIHSAWNALPRQGRPKHPFGEIVQAWIDRPRQVEPETRRDKRILPVARVIESRPERQRGQLFGGLLDGREAADLPLFPQLAPVRKSVAILDLADASGVPVMAKGRGAPLPQRLFIRTGLTVRLEDRSRQSVRLALTVRELRDGLFPNGADKWGARDWPALKAALMGARDYTIRLPDGGRWLMLALRRLPAEDRRGLPNLDDIVVLDVAFPPGMSDGAPVDLPTLDALSVESAPRWRAYIAAHALSWVPGRTRRPAPRSGRWLWSRKPSDYPILTAEDRRRLAYGEADRKHRGRKDVDAAWRNLPGLTLVAERAVDPRTREMGWRYMPADVAPDASGDDGGKGQPANRGGSTR